MKTKEKKLTLKKLEVTKLSRPELIQGGTGGHQGDTLVPRKTTITGPTRK